MDAVKILEELDDKFNVSKSFGKKIVIDNQEDQFKVFFQKTHKRDRISNEITKHLDGTWSFKAFEVPRNTLKFREEVWDSNEFTPDYIVSKDDLSLDSLYEEFKRLYM